MRNDKLVTDYLDFHQETMKLMRSGEPDDRAAAKARIASGRSDDLWEACLENGWKHDELEAAFARRFGGKIA